MTRLIVEAGDLDVPVEAHAGVVVDLVDLAEMLLTDSAYAANAATVHGHTSSRSALTSAPIARATVPR